MAEHSFEVKLARAKVHLDALETELCLRVGDLYVVTRKHDADGLGYVDRVDEVKPVPDGITAIFGDCLQNLRNVLDHIVWEIAPPTLVPFHRPFFPGHVGPLPKDRPPVLTRDEYTAKPAFPIALWPADFNADAGRLLQLLSKEARAAVEGLQPYKGWYPFDPGARSWTFAPRHPLERLNELVNIDKHRAIHPVVAAARLSHYFGPSIPNWGSATFYMGGREIQPGTELMRVRYASAEMAREVKMDHHFTFGVTLQDTSPEFDEFLPEPLYTILRFIEDEAIPALTPFLRDPI